MIRPDRPQDEEKRLKALESLGVLDTEPEERFDRLTRIASQVFGVPIAEVSFIDRDRQWIKSKVGPVVDNVPRDLSFCAHAILSNKTMVVKNALEDKRFFDNPFVLNAPFIRSYAGAPLKLIGGAVVGTLCVVGTKPRTYSRSDLKLLRDLADCVQAELNQLFQRNFVQQMRKQEKYLTAVLDTVIDGILTINDQGIIQTVNPAAVEMFGYQSSELLGQNVNMLMPEPYHSEHGMYLENYRRTGNAKIIGIGREVIGRRKDSSVFPLDLAVNKMELDDDINFVGVLRDISESKKNQQALVQLKDTLDQTVDAVFIYRMSDFRFIYVNQGAQKQVGYSEEELMQMDVLAIKRQHTRESFLEFIKPLIQGAQQSLTFETFHRHRDGHEIPVEVVLQIIEYDGFEPRVVSIVRDVTERKAVERMKNEFISTVSHELRTPLTSIHGALGLTLSGAVGELEPSIRSLIEMANRNCYRLSRLINDILDLEKIESGKMVFEFKVVNLIDLIRQSVESMTGYQEKYKVRIDVETNVRNAYFWADEHRFLQVMANLLSNAIKYSPEGGVVRVFVFEENETYRFEIKDAGPGIPDHFQGQIFSRFAQADSSDSRARDGTGLGLSITKAIVERHGGKIGFQTQLGVGTTFYFSIPSRALPDRDELDLRTPPLALICEASGDWANVLFDFFKREGFECWRAENSSQAIESIENKRFDLILVDFGFKEQDEAAFLVRLGEELGNTRVPLIVLSTEDEKKACDPVLSSFSSAQWIPKPVAAAGLHKALINALELNSAPKVLHIEDDRDIVQIVRTVVQGSFQYSYVATLAAAREKLRSEHYDLVLLDVLLPDGSGIELLFGETISCPIIVFSSANVETQTHGAVAAVLLKASTSNEQLLLTIRRVFYQSILRKRQGESRA